MNTSCMHACKCMQGSKFFENVASSIFRNVGNKSVLHSGINKEQIKYSHYFLI
jgi:hypothetical protein